MTQTLKGITQDILALESLLLEAEGDLTNPALEEWMTINEENMAGKIDAYKHMMDHMEAGIEYFKQKAIEAVQARKIYENQIERMKERLRFTMTELTTSELIGTDYRFKLSKTKPKVIITDDQKIPVCYLTEKLEYTPNKEAIKIAIEKGEIIQGAHLEENYSLKPYFNKR